MTKLHEYQKRIIKEFRKQKSYTIEVIPRLKIEKRSKKA